MRTRDRYSIEKTEEWRKIGDGMPYLEIPDGLMIKVIPPFAGAMARFIISNGVDDISVYYDAYENLGYMGEPYWEAYPIGDDVGRFLKDETKELMDAIVKELSK